MHLVVNGWFWDQLATGSGQYLHHILHYLPLVGPGHTYTVMVPAPAPSSSTSAASHLAPDTSHFAPIPPPPATYFVRIPVARGGDNLAKLWFEQVGFPNACRVLKADRALVPYWGSPLRTACLTAVTVHDLIPLLLPAYRGGLRQRAYTHLVSQAARQATVVLTDSQASRRDIVQHLAIPAERVHAVVLAADERFQRVTESDGLARVRERYALPERFILYLGGFDARKNVPRLLRAYGRLVRGWQVNDGPPNLVIAGTLPAADTSFTPDPRRIAGAEGIAGHTSFIGWVDEVDKPALYSLAQAFVFPSLYEGYGLPVAEAAACGTPVVTSNISSLPEAAPDAILVDPYSEESIAQGIRQALMHTHITPGDARRSWQDVARETLQVLTQIA